MWFARLTGFLILLGGVYCLWRFIVKPILERHGIECDDEPEVIPTQHETRRDDLKDDLDKSRRSADAAEEMVDMTDEKVGLDQTIKDAERNMEDK